MIEFTNRRSSRAFDMKGCYLTAIILLGVLLAALGVGIAQAQGPTIENVNAGNINDTSAVITWTTTDRANSIVNYGNTTSLGSTVSGNTFVTEHAFTLAFLTPSTVYYYEVISSNPSGDTTVDNNNGAYHTFTTLGRKENLGYLVAAYTIVWTAIAGYVFTLSRRQKRLWREIDSLKAKMAEKGED